jgi:hypothetical protein
VPTPKRRVGEADRLLGEAEHPRREQDLHDERGVVAGLPEADGERHRDEQPAAGHEGDAGLHLAPEDAPRIAGLRPPLHRLSHPEAAEDGGREQHRDGIEQQRHRRSGQLDEGAGEPGARDLRARMGERVAGERLDQALASDHLREDDLRRAAGHRVDGADDEADGVQPVHREPARPPRHGHARDRRGDGALADDVHRQLADAVEPDARGQRQQHERGDLHRRQEAHLQRRRVQQQRGRERQGEHRHLPADRAHEDRDPEPPIGGVAQQVPRRQTEPGEQGSGVAGWGRQKARDRSNG